jgi:hypothetical protein
MNELPKNLIGFDFQSRRYLESFMLRKAEAEKRLLKQKNREDYELVKMVMISSFITLLGIYLIVRVVLS